MKKYILHRSINLFIVFLGILTTGGFTSCNFLRVDDYFDDTMKFDSIFTKYEYLVQYMWGNIRSVPRREPHPYRSGHSRSDGYG